MAGGLILIAVGSYLFRVSTTTTAVPEERTTPPLTATTAPPVIDTATTAPSSERGPETVIGTSAGGEAITAYHFGTGEKEILLIGGIHGGYSWGTALLAHTFIDYFKDNPGTVPENVTVTIIPAFNADGLMATVKTTGLFNEAAVPKDEAARTAGRFNENEVDLNRNFDCEWKASGQWQSRAVSGGTRAFSEPEAAALRDYVTTKKPHVAIGWYSAAGGVYAASCGEAVSKDTRLLMNLFAKASGYQAYETFDYYEVTGDMMNWLAKEDVPAISVLLTNHNNIEWEKNRAGVEAVIKDVAAE